MAHNIKVSLRVRDLAIGVLAALLAVWLTGCEGVGGTAGTGPGLKKSDAGVTYCDIPSPSGDVAYTYSNGTKSSYTMREWFVKRAVSGVVSDWGVLQNLSDFGEVCAATPGTTAATCAAALSDESKYCFYAKEAWNSSENRFDYQVGKAAWDAAKDYYPGVAGRWDSDSRKVFAALCTPEGVFAGWLCWLK
jgi:hypothetical protein